MAEFGHFAAGGAGWRIDSWGAGPFIIRDAKGRPYVFEDSDRFGPSIVTTRGEISSVQPGERSPFWRAHRIWVRQGRRTKPEGEWQACLWDEPRPTIVRRYGRRWIVIQDGDEDGAVIRRRPAPSPTTGAAS